MSRFLPLNSKRMLWLRKQRRRKKRRRRRRQKPRSNLQARVGPRSARAPVTRFNIHQSGGPRARLLIYRSVNASLAPGAAKPPAKPRRSQVIAVGRDELRQERQEEDRQFRIDDVVQKSRDDHPLARAPVKPGIDCERPSLAQRLPRHDQQIDHATPLQRGVKRAQARTSPGCQSMAAV